jgi:hypothetical protein
MSANGTIVAEPHLYLEPVTAQAADITELPPTATIPFLITMPTATPPFGRG